MARVEPVLRPSALVVGRSEAVDGSIVARSGVSESVEVPLVSPIAEAISESGERAEFRAVVAVGSVLPSADDNASLKLVDPLPVVAPSDAPPESVEVAEEARALPGSVSCCCIARIWSMRLVTASILILHWDRRAAPAT